MTAPIDETWEARGDLLDFPENASVRFSDFSVRFVDVPFETTARAIARAKLAAQAPAMARLLLKHQWASTVEDGPMVCPECSSGPIERHSEDCEIARVLRDAGVLP